jgi:PAP_fibrillin
LFALKTQLNAIATERIMLQKLFSTACCLDPVCSKHFAYITYNRTAVNELILKLEPMNPTEAPAQSAQLNGVWEILYTGGISPSMLAVQLLSKV